MGKKTTKQPQQVTGQVSHTSQVKQPIWILQIFGFSWKEIGIMCLACSQWSVKTNRFGSFPVIIRDFAIRKHLFQTVPQTGKTPWCFGGSTIRQESSPPLSSSAGSLSLPSQNCQPRFNCSSVISFNHWVYRGVASWQMRYEESEKFTRDRDQMTLNLWPSQLPPPEKRV